MKDAHEALLLRINRLNRSMLDVKGIKLVFRQKLATSWIELHLSEEPLIKNGEDEDSSSQLIDGKGPISTEASSTAGD